MNARASTGTTFIAALAAGAWGLLPGAATGSDDLKEKAASPLVCDLNSKVDPRDAPWTRSGWQKHGVIRLDGSTAKQILEAEL